MKLMVKSNIILLIILVIGFGSIFVGIATAHNEVVEGENLVVTIHSDGLIRLEPNVAYIWQSESYDVLLGPTAKTAGHHYIYCIDGPNVEDSCEQGELDEGRAFGFSVAPGNTGTHRMTARIHEDRFGYNNPLLEEVSFTVRVIAKHGDLDNDGLQNQREFRENTDFTIADSDEDGLTDGQEVNQVGTDPRSSDTDDDELSDGDEVNRYRTDPTESDTDNDDLDDGEEINEYSTDPNNAHTDGDGLTDGVEVNRYQTNPAKTDTDGDGLDDGTEIELGTDPTTTDTDGDEVPDGVEDREGTDPTKMDTDDDGVTDGIELDRGMDPTKTDTDSDGLDDAVELRQQQTDPTDDDTDGDGLSDGDEINEFGTDPTKDDSDGDGIADGVEVRRGSDPTDPASPSPTPQPTQKQTHSTEQSRATETTESQAGSPSQPLAQETNSGENEFRRGFFTNNPESDSFLETLSGPEITALGFILSITGILVEMRRGG